MKETGKKKWDNMLAEVNQAREKWRTDFKAKKDAGDQEYLDQIEKMLDQKKAWTDNFMQKMRENSEEATMHMLYDSIQSTIAGMQKSMPQGVVVDVNVNDILSRVMQKKPGSTLDDLLKNAGKYVDTNFFMSALKTYNFNDSSILKEFDALLEKKDNGTRQMATLQTLEGLMSLPHSFAETIQKANERLNKGLDEQMLRSEFFRMGDHYVRSFEGPTGRTMYQTLPTYQFFQYDEAKSFPHIKDANDTKWDMGNIQSLMTKEAPEAGELGVMVKLARNQMMQDFKKVYDPDKKVDYETALAAGDPEAYGNAVNAGLSNLNSASCLNYSDYTDENNVFHSAAEQCATAAAKSDYLVGDVEGGEFGKSHFDQFYVIMKMKRNYDKVKGNITSSRERRFQGMGRLYGGIADIAAGAVQVVKSGIEFTKDTFNMYVDANKAALSGNKDWFSSRNLHKNYMNKMSHDAQGMAQGTAGIVEGMVAPVVGLLLDVMSDFTQTPANQFIERNLNPIRKKMGVGGIGLDNIEKKGTEFDYELNRFRKRNQNAELRQHYQDQMVENDQPIDTAITVGLTAASVIPSPIAPIAATALVAYKTTRGAYEGGAMGAGLAFASSFAATFGAEGATNKYMLNVNLGYSYRDGYSAGIGVGYGSKKFGVQAGISWNEKTGFGRSVGMNIGNYNLGYNERYDANGNLQVGWSVGVQGKYKKGMLGGVLSHDTQNGWGASISYTQGVKYFGSTLNSGLGYTQGTGFTGVYSNTFGRDFTWPGTREAANQEKADDVVNGGGYEATRREEKEKDALSAAYNLAGRNGTVDPMGDGYMINGKFYSTDQLADMQLNDIIKGKHYQTGDGVNRENNQITIDSNSVVSPYDILYATDDKQYKVYDPVTGKEMSLEELRANTVDKLRNKLQELKDSGKYKGNIEQDIPRLLKEYSNLDFGQKLSSWQTISNSDASKATIIASIDVEGMSISDSGQVSYDPPGTVMGPQSLVVTRTNGEYYTKYKSSLNGVPNSQLNYTQEADLYHRMYDAQNDQWLFRPVLKVPRNESPLMYYKGLPEWANYYNNIEWYQSKRYYPYDNQLPNRNDLLAP